MLGKLLFRILLIGLALVTVPLAIQNRAPVTLILDPTELLAGEPRASFTLPLFVALLLALGLGLIIGYAGGQMAARRQSPRPNTPNGNRKSRRQQSADALAARALAAHSAEQATAAPATADRLPKPDSMIEENDATAGRGPVENQDQNTDRRQD